MLFYLLFIWTNISFNRRAVTEGCDNEGVEMQEGTMEGW